MAGNIVTGRKAEDIALDWLLHKGFALIERNCRVGHKEMDLVMESEERIHIVEVKSLSAPLLLEPSEKVNLKKQKLLAAAAAWYVKRHQLVKEVQFDIVSVVFEGDCHTVEYIPEAFFPVYYGH